MEALRQCIDYILHFAGFPEVVKVGDSYLGNSKVMPYEFVQALVSKIVPQEMVDPVEEEAAIPLSFTAPPPEAMNFS